MAALSRSAPPYLAFLPLSAMDPSADDSHDDLVPQKTSCQHQAMSALILWSRVFRIEGAQGIAVHYVTVLSHLHVHNQQ